MTPNASTVYNTTDGDLQTLKAIENSLTEMYVQSYTYDKHLESQGAYVSALVKLENTFFLRRL